MDCKTSPSLWVKTFGFSLTVILNLLANMKEDG